MKIKDKNILIVTSEFPPQPGGIGNHAYNLAKQLLKSGYMVEVITDQRSVDGDPELHFDNSLEFPVYRIGLKKLRLFMYLNRLIILLKLIKNSEVIVASGKFSLWSVAFASLFYKRKFVAVIHGSEVNFKHNLLKFSINKSISRFNHVIAVSQFTKGLMSKLRMTPVEVIPNGIDPVLWNIKKPAIVSLKGSPKLMTVGRVSERKGQIHVIRQLPELLKQYPNIHYHCVGIPTEQETCLVEADRLNVRDHVTFHGQVTDSELYALVYSSDLFVMLSAETSQGDVEGFGIAIMEANALGVPAIGAKNTGVEDAILDGKSGILVPYNDTQELLKAIETISLQKDYYALESKQWANNHTWDLIIKRYISVLES